MFFPKRRFTHCVLDGEEQRQRQRRQRTTPPCPMGDRRRRRRGQPSSGAGNTAPSAMVRLDDRDADGHPLKRAPQEGLTHLTQVCYLPKPKSDDDVKPLRPYAGCLGLTHGSFQRQDGTFETMFEIKACLCPFTCPRTDCSWIRSATTASDGTIRIVPNSSLVLLDGDILQRIGSCPYEPA